MLASFRHRNSSTGYTNDVILTDSEAEKTADFTEILLHVYVDLSVTQKTERLFIGRVEWMFSWSKTALQS